MNLNQLRAAAEAILFAHAEPVASARLAETLEVKEEDVLRLLHTMQEEYGEERSGLVLLCLDGRWQLAAKTEYAPFIRRLTDARRNAPLSAAALETLAVIAYNQPVSRAFIEQVRGVDSSSSVQKLLQKGLIEEAGRLDLPGKPLSFATTDVFLRTFGLTSLADLPPLHEERQAEVPAGEQETVCT